MRRIIVILATLAPLLAGCKKNGEVHFVGVTDFTFNGVTVNLPNQGIGSTGATPTTLDFEWAGKRLTIEDLRDGTVSVTTPKTKGLIVPKDHVISIDNDGNVSTKKRASQPKKEEPQQGEEADAG